jgi:hypothetical protein
MYPSALRPRLSIGRAERPLDRLEGEHQMKLQVNVGRLDRMARLAAGIALVAVALLGVVVAPIGIIAGVIGTILLATGATGFCPLYALFGASTCPVRR